MPPSFGVQLLVVFVCAAATWLMLRSLIPWLSKRLLDRPNLRSSHRKPTPRGGGVVFVGITALGCVLLAATPSGLSLIPLLALPLAFVGLLDDRHDLPASLRFAVQVLTAVGLVAISPLFIPFLLAFPLVVLVTAVINFTNFMDGLDGLVASCMAVAIAAVAIRLNASMPIWSLVGALIGFLLWNWSPARVFMGDVGSTFLGAVFAGLALQASSWDQALGFFLVVSPLLGDALVTVLRRVWIRQRVFQAHRLHLFQRLHQAGWPHESVATTYLVATAATAAAMLTGNLVWAVVVVCGEFLIAFWLDQRVAVPFAVAAGAQEPKLS